MQMGQVKLRGMGQRGQQNVAMTSFIAPQVGPSMTPGFLFATDQGAPQNVPVGPVTPTQVAPTPVAAAPAAPAAPSAPAASDGKTLLGPLAVVAVVAGIVAWTA